MPLIRIATSLLFLLTGLTASAIHPGMSPKEARMELGSPTGELSRGAITIQQYANGTKLKFRDGKLVELNDEPITAQKAREVIPQVPEVITATKEADPPVLESKEAIQQQPQPAPPAPIETPAPAPKPPVVDYEDSYVYDTYEYKEPTFTEKLLGISIGFGVEFFITLVVLTIAFKMSGFSYVWSQMLALSIGTSLTGSVLSFFFQMGPTNPFGGGIGFLVLLGMIKTLTDVREWATAIKIAVTARLVSMGLTVAVLAGLSFTL